MLSEAGAVHNVDGKRWGQIKLVLQHGAWSVVQPTLDKGWRQTQISWTQNRRRAAR